MKVLKTCVKLLERSSWLRLLVSRTLVETFGKPAASMFASMPAEMSVDNICVLGCCAASARVTAPIPAPLSRIVEVGVIGDAL